MAEDDVQDRREEFVWHSGWASFDRAVLAAEHEAAEHFGASRLVYFEVVRAVIEHVPQGIKLPGNRYGEIPRTVVTLTCRVVSCP